MNDNNNNNNTVHKNVLIRIKINLSSSCLWWGSKWRIVCCYTTKSCFARVFCTHGKRQENDKGEKKKKKKKSMPANSGGSEANYLKSYFNLRCSWSPIVWHNQHINDNAMMRNATIDNTIEAYIVIISSRKFVFFILWHIMDFTDNSGTLQS